MPASILIVDDDVLYANAVGDAFRAAGFTVYLTHDAASALTTAQALRPALIVTDLQMPGFGNGADAARAMRKEAALKTVPILFLSGLSEPEARRMIGDISASRFISKNASLGDLVAAATQTLSARGRI